MLELDEGQLSRPVLRGRGGSNTSLLPGRLVDGSSQRGRACAQPDPAGGAWSGRRGAWGGRRGAGDQWPGGCWAPTQPGVRGARQWVAASALSADLGAGWG